MNHTEDAQVMAEHVPFDAKVSSDSESNGDSSGKELPAVSETPENGNQRVVANHYNNLRDRGRVERLESRIVHMRNFNNWIKSQLISEYLNRIRQDRVRGEPLRVLDMCCGKGGDLLKYSKANINHLICTDIAEISVEQCKRRYEELKANAEKSRFSRPFTAEFFNCDATLVRYRERYRDASIKLHLVSCQFAFHYAFESFAQAACMVRNAAECLQEGGYFIATIPDANEIMRRLRESPNGRSFGNDIYNIEFECETEPPPLFGAKYNFHLEDVVDCPEFLVHFPTLVKLCRKHGLQLERRSTFAEYYQENAVKGKRLLQRMVGLQTVYPNRVANNPEYAHLRDAPHSSSTQAHALGTISQSEWQAITLYMVCSFRKCKNVWDAEGKPVFQFDPEPKRLRLE